MHPADLEARHGRDRDLRPALAQGGARLTRDGRPARPRRAWPSTAHAARGRRPRAEGVHRPPSRLPPPGLPVPWTGRATSTSIRPARLRRGGGDPFSAPASVCLWDRRPESAVSTITCCRSFPATLVAAFRGLRHARPGGRLLDLACAGPLEQRYSAAPASARRRGRRHSVSRTCRARWPRRRSGSRGGRDTGGSRGRKLMFSTTERFG